jgi:N-(2-amino-2-carboxyethyl)-L-glutamate synthase
MMRNRHCQLSVPIKSGEDLKPIQGWENARAIDEGILSTVGNTPLISLNRVFKDNRIRLFAKMEGFNPGGSAKDRPALNILKKAIAAGEIDSKTVVIESSSGNLGVGLAQACGYLGLRFICVVDPKTTQQNISILKVYGAEIDMVTAADPQTGEYLEARINRVRSLLRSIENSFWPNQYANLNNADAHYNTTMREIDEALDGKIDYLFCATSTCGTIRGCADYVQDHRLRTRIIAVDAIGSVIFGGQSSKRLIPGHGAMKRPDLYRPNMADQCIQVSDLDCVVGCRRLLHREAILAGGSSGGVLMAVDRIKHRLPSGATCVAIFPDRGERYLDTIYSDDWVREKFGDVSSRWKEDEAESREESKSHDQ